MSDPDYIAEVLAHVRSLSAGEPLDPDARVNLHFQPDICLASGASVLDGIASSGVYRSQFETGVSGGGLSAYPGGDRFMWEQRMFASVYNALHLGVRPKYGALNLDRDPYGAAPRFGSCYFRLTPVMLARTTFCYPDSVFQPASFATADQFGLLDALARPPTDDPLDHYIEAHVHGPVLIPRDVEALVLDPSYRGTDIEAAAEHLDCPLEWHPGYRVALEVVRQHPAYRGQEIVHVAEKIAEHGQLTPEIIGRARVTATHDPQQLKKVWHYLARYG